MIEEKISEIEDKIIPIKDFLESNKNDDKYKSLYKGFITLECPLVVNPDILFIGINPGHGAFKENKNRGTNETIRLFNPESEIIHDWFKDNTARGGNQGNGWKSYHWFQRDKPINNPFPARMIDLLYEIAEYRFGKNEKDNFSEAPSWFKSFGQNIMHTNLYPIATTETKDLNKIFRHLKNEHEIKTILNKQNGLKEWDIKLFFISKIKNLVQLIQPKVIVCMGTTAFNDFTYTHEKKVDNIFKLEENNRPVIGFSRSGNWSGLISKLAKLIADELK
ncbi:hypothetical protein SAMN05444285_1676 [Draconibacterium orientale]|uniref:Uracil DNA glycosylase superfamily protein n=1 Tax=Draconibacterium orientale TaxID=1168034 RepID=X5DLV8_9BACT|nr:hypothetical protein [Draconibacterium orientale]AHW61557.1 hypothetical protein FH5T_03735 [Draconibacterium orientale]SEU16359.1 hypothetical protein SAMN05444285_1676 [Draconibacterium orientale]